MIKTHVNIPIVLFFCFFASIKVNAQTEIKPVGKYVDFGFKKVEARKIEAIIVHSVFNNSGGDFYDVDLILKQFSHYRVSAHYVIGRDGTIYQLVKERDIAYHAGKSRLPDGRKGVNSRSIGIELITAFTEAPTNEQIQALAALTNNIKSRYSIKFVLRHSDIAPGRKTDPWNMNWDDFLSKLNE